MWKSQVAHIRMSHVIETCCTYTHTSMSHVTDTAYPPSFSASSCVGVLQRVYVLCASFISPLLCSCLMSMIGVWFQWVVSYTNEPPLTWVSHVSRLIRRISRTSCIRDTCQCVHRVIFRNTQQHTAKHCNTQQHYATYCNPPQNTATHSDTMQHTATHCNPLQHTATLCNTLQQYATHCNTLQYTAAHCNTL